MNKILKTVLIAILAIVVIGVLLAVFQGFSSSFNPGAQIQRVQNQSQY